MWKLRHSSLFGSICLMSVCKEQGPRALSFGRVSMNWLLATMEDLLHVEATKKFLNPSGVGSKAFISQWSVNKFGHYVVVMEYGGGGWRSLWRS
jgi:hypothetical protein